MSLASPVGALGFGFSAEGTVAVPASIWPAGVEIAGHLHSVGNASCCPNHTDCVH